MKFSYEVFPARTAKGHKSLEQSMHRLKAINPTLISVTYGAGGGERERSFASVELANNHAGCPVAAHLTCVGIRVIMVGTSRRCGGGRVTTRMLCM